MSTAHTPGPWEFVDNSLVGPKLDGSPIWLRDVILQSEVGVKTVDAQLIAAAPELLAALQWCKSQGFARYVCRIQGQNEDFCDSVDRMDEAIAKATGVAA